MRLTLAIIALCLTTNGLTVVAQDQPTEKSVASDKRIEPLEPDIAAKIAKQPQISPELLRRIQQDKKASDSIVIVDCRSESEFKVSVIPGAITKEHYEANRDKFKDKTVVTYCLSGGRSGKYMKQLREKNIPVTDLHGSIKGWLEAGLPLSTLDGKPTTKVNVYGNKVPPQYQSVE